MRDGEGALIGVVIDLFPRSVPRAPRTPAHAAYLASAEAAESFMAAKVTARFRSSDVAAPKDFRTATSERLEDATVAIQCALYDHDRQVGDGAGHAERQVVRRGQSPQAQAPSSGGTRPFIAAPHRQLAQPRELMRWLALAEDVE